MNMPDPVFMMRPGERVESLEEKGPEHVATEHVLPGCFFLGNF
jgi:hypothetical protein